MSNKCSLARYLEDGAANHDPIHVAGCEAEGVSNTSKEEKSESGEEMLDDGAEKETEEGFGTQEDNDNGRTRSRVQIRERNVQDAARAGKSGHRAWYRRM